MIPIVECGKHFPETPDTALVERIAGKLALAANAPLARPPIARPREGRSAVTQPGKNASRRSPHSGQRKSWSAVSRTTPHWMQRKRETGGSSGRSISHRELVWPSGADMRPYRLIQSCLGGLNTSRSTVSSSASAL